MWVCVGGLEGEWVGLRWAGTGGGGFDNTTSLYRQHANLAGTLSGHSSWVLSVAFSPDNQHFVTG